MAETTNLTIRIDKELKEQAEIFFNELGLSITTAFNIFVRQSLRQGRIPFEITLKTDDFYNPENMKFLHQSIQDAKEGKLTVHELIED